MRRRVALLPSVLLAACSSAKPVTLGDAGPPRDAGPGSGSDAGLGDQGALERPDTGDAPRDTGPLLDVGPRPDTGTDPGFEIDCAACRSDGQTCVFSINCQAGSICNDPAEELYDPAAPQGVCRRVVCRSDMDCSAPNACTLAHLCRPRVCRADPECAAGQVCAAGACAARPTAASVATCRVLTGSRSVRTGTRVALQAIAFDASGAALPGVSFRWTSSRTDVAAIAGTSAVGESASGAASITAVSDPGAVACTPAISITNLGLVAQGSLRVVVTAEEDGAPIAGAQVIAGAAQMVTGADGTVTLAGAGAPAAVTAIATGRRAVSVLSPGTNDIGLALAKLPDPTRAGGVRGSVDISSTRRADIGTAVVGVPLAASPLDPRFGAVAGDQLDTLIDAPDLGLNNQNVSMPGGFLLSLGSKRFTDDSTAPGGGRRCQGMAPAAGALGCFAVRAQVGSGAAWTLAGQLRLSQVSRIAGRLSMSLGGDIDPEALLVELSPLIRRLSHGVRLGLTITDAPAVNGMPDHSRYQPIAIAADAPLSVLDVVRVPELPRLPGSGWAARAVLLSGTVVPGAGLVPLGLTAAPDERNSGAADGRVAGEERPFGDVSDPVPDGAMALASAPAHGGLESFPRALVLVASPEGDARGARRAMRIVFGATDAVGGAFLAYPGGNFDTTARTFTLSAPSSGATLYRIEIGDRWVVHAPAGMGPIALPDVPALIALVTRDSDVSILAVAAGGYPALWTFGGEGALENGLAVIQATSRTDCRHAVTSLCRIF